MPHPTSIHPRILSERIEKSWIPVQGEPNSDKFRMVPTMGELVARPCLDMFPAEAGGSASVMF